MIWSGAPMCILIRNDKSTINRIQRKIIQHFDTNLDLIIREVHVEDPRMKMVALPQLCKENEQNGKVSF